MLGKTGSGKSSLANTISGEELFKISHKPNAETRECQAETRSVNGRSITLIDTPGFFDTDKTKEKLKPEIVKCITECAPGPHAFLILLKVERFTEHEQDVINKIQEYFSDEAFKYATVVFTHGDQLTEGETIEKFVIESKGLSDLVRKCGGRCHVIDNRYWKEKPKDEYRSNQFQVEALLKTIEEMVTENEGKCYTNKMLEAVEEMIKQEEENFGQSSENKTEEEIREKAKSRVYNVLIRLAGVGIGALLGAFLGVAVMVKTVVTAIHSLPAIVETAAAATGAVGAIVGADANATTAAAGGAAVATAIFGAVGTSAAAGAVIGGVEGYRAAEGAATPWEAAERAAEAVENGAQSLCSTTKDAVDRMSQPK